MGLLTFGVSRWQIQRELINVKVTGILQHSSTNMLKKNEIRHQ